VRTTGGDTAPKSIAEIARIYAKSRPDKPAFIHGDEIVTYAQLDERSNRVANGLLAEGIGHQDHIGFLDKNCLEFFDFLFGAAKVNAIHAGINWRLSPHEILQMINHAESKLLVVGQEFVPVLEEIESELKSVNKVLVVGGHTRHEDFESWRDGQPATDPGGEPAAEDAVFLLYTSGTTGSPKGAMIANRAFFDLKRICTPLWGIAEDSVLLVNLPMFHIGGIGWSTMATYRGGTAVVVRENLPSELLEVIERHKVTNCFLVPALLQFMTTAPGVEERDFSYLRVMLYGAAPISVEVLKRSMRIFGCKFAGAYGLTESCNGVTTLPWEDHDADGPRAHLLQSAGKAHPNVTLRIADPVNGDELTHGEVGEIWVRSDQLMKGYWKNPEATAETLNSDGWLRTGDAGYLSEDGYLFITDRIKDMIISGGENIYPVELENVLMSHPAIADVAVIGVPSERWGETPKVIVVLGNEMSATGEEILNFCRDQIARYKCPTSVDFIDELPRGATGKVLKKELRAPFWRGREKSI
jgi:long-chain acyl-CoA synthetase